MNRLKCLLLVSASCFAFTTCYDVNCMESEEEYSVEDSQKMQKNDSADRRIKKKNNKLKRSQKSKTSKKHKRSKKNDSKRILSVLRLCKKPKNKKACEHLQRELPKAIQNLDQPDVENNLASTTESDTNNIQIIASEIVPLKVEYTKKPTKISYRLNNQLSSQLKQELEAYRKADKREA